MNEESSYRGAGIKEIISRATEACKHLKRKKIEGVVIIQGRGNSLKAWAPEDTITSVMDGLYEMLKENLYVQVIISSVLLRPRESSYYGEMLTYTNFLSKKANWIYEWVAK